MSSGKEACLASDNLTDKFYWRQIEDSLFVADLCRQEFTILNRSAGLIWLSILDHPCTPTDLAAMLADTFGSDRYAMLLDVKTIIAQWKDLGWTVEYTEEGIAIPSVTDDQRRAPYQAVPEHVLREATATTTDEWQINCDLAGKPVSVHFRCDQGMANSDLSIRAKSFLSGIPDAGRPSDQPIICYLTDSGCYLKLADTCVHAVNVSDALSRLVLWIFHKGYGADQMLGTFHAAAVGRPEGAILLPGLSGRGKSTLTGYLVGNGWLYGGDDIIGLGKPDAEHAPPLVLPFCSALSVKDASIPLLEPYYPGLIELPVINYDVKCARFASVPPRLQMGAHLGPRRINAIVFPHFDKQAQPAQITSLSTIEALIALSGVGYRTGERMDGSLLEGFLNFFEFTPKYRLDFSDLRAAERILRDLPCYRH